MCSSVYDAPWQEDAEVLARAKTTADTQLATRVTTI